MGGFRRFVLFVFSLAGILCLAALALPWFGLLGDVIGPLQESDWYVVAVEVCLGMTGAWLVWNLLRSVLSRRDDSISVMSVDGGTITVARAAVASQASHIVEALGVGTASDVDVRAGRRGPVRVRVRVTPYESIDVTSEAPVLHEGLTAGLTAMCGERLGAVDVEFLEPVRPSSLVEALPQDGSGEQDPVAIESAETGEAVRAAEAVAAGEVARAAEAGVHAAETGAHEAGLVNTVAQPAETVAGGARAGETGAVARDGIVIPMRGERGERDGR